MNTSSWMCMKKKRGYFSISAVAEMFSVHQQTIRLYEKEGLINPKRSEGNTRLFSEEDIQKLEEVIYLTHQLGINLAGVEMILKLQRKIKRLQKDMNRLLDSAQEELVSDEIKAKQQSKLHARKLLQLKKKKSTSSTKPEASESSEKTQQWEVDYDE